MIGLTFLAIGLLWLAFSVFVGHKLPKWLGIQGLAKQWAITVAAVVVLLVGPFVDHIVGMRQFEKLCAEEGRLQISPAAANTKRAKKMIEDYVPLEGYAVRIEQMVIRVVDLDTDKQIAQYKYFSTPGGRLSGRSILGNPYVCSASDRDHADRSKLDALAAQTHLVF
jgi:hypothetical protein